jgi:hypothetical protein
MSRYTGGLYNSTPRGPRIGTREPAARTAEGAVGLPIVRQTSGVKARSLSRSGQEELVAGLSAGRKNRRTHRTGVVPQIRCIAVPFRRSFAFLSWLPRKTGALPETSTRTVRRSFYWAKSPLSAGPTGKPSPDLLTVVVNGNQRRGINRWRQVERRDMPQPTLELSRKNSAEGL